MNDTARVGFPVLSSTISFSKAIAAPLQMLCRNNARTDLCTARVCWLVRHIVRDAIGSPPVLPSHRKKCNVWCVLSQEFCISYSPINSSRLRVRPSTISKEPSRGHSSLQRVFFFCPSIYYHKVRLGGRPLTECGTERKGNR